MGTSSEHVERGCGSKVKMAGIPRIGCLWKWKMKDGRTGRCD